MQDTAKYLIHADIAADGVVERSDVVGAVFGQTEGLLGDELDLRHLQDSSKVGRIDVDVDSENGQSFGTITIASSLDQVETAILAAALETIDRVGPCRARVSVTDIEDVRAAKRREVVERAKELLVDSFEGSYLTSEELIEEVRRTIRVEDITEYNGYPAGPRVTDSDAIVVVEGRSDVLTLLRYGIKNAIAVEGTNVPEEVANLTADRTVTAFLDGDRGGELILEELAQVGNVDYVAFAPEGSSVEDLSRPEVMAALREKVPYESVAEAGSPRARLEGPQEPPDAPTETETDAAADATLGAEASDQGAEAGPESSAEANVEAGVESGETEAVTRSGAGAVQAERVEPEPSEPETLRGHVNEVIAEETGIVRLLDSGFETLAEAAADEAFDAIESADPVPSIVVLDDEVSQRVLDVAAQRGVDQIICRTEGEFVKKPTSVRLRTADQL